MTKRYSFEFSDPRGAFGLAMLKREGAAVDVGTGKELEAWPRSPLPKRRKPKTITVSKLIAELQKHPKGMKVALVYDSQVMCVDALDVAKWRDNDGKVYLALFDQPAEADDDRLA